MLETRTVSGTIHKATGDVWPFAEVTFKLRQNAGAGGIVVPQFPEVITADEDGHFECELYTVTDSFLPYRCTLPNGRGFKFDLPPGDEITLDVLQDLGPLEDEDSISAALINAITLALVWNNITGKPSTFPPATHNHDDRYLTESETTTLISNLVAGAPGALDTLNELAAALGDDANFATTITNLIAEKQSLSEKDQPGGYPGLNGENAIATNHLGQELRSHSIVHEKVSSYPEKTVSVDGDGNILANKIDETSGFFVIDSNSVFYIKSIRSDEQAFVHGDVLYLRNGTSADLVLKNNDGGTGISLIWASSAAQWVFPPDALMLARFDGNANRFYVSLIFGTPETRFGPSISGDITIDGSNWFDYMDKWVIVAPSGNLTITIADVPSNFSCTFYQRGSNDPVVIASTTHTLRNRQSHDKLAGEFAVAGVKVEGTNGDLIFFGDTKA